MLRPCDLDRSEKIWVYRPESHKTEHHGRERVIFVGPKAQAEILPYLLRDAEAYCFSPSDSERTRKAERRNLRKTKVQPSQIDRRKSRPIRKPRARYFKDAYARAISRAAEKANEAAIRAARESAAARGETFELGPGERLLRHWTPNQLRHTAATEIRRKYGLEGAQVVLGHAKADVTQVYAERDQRLAATIMAEVG